MFFYFFIWGGASLSEAPTNIQKKGKDFLHGKRVFRRVSGGGEAGETGDGTCCGKLTSQQVLQGHSHGQK